MKLQGVMTIELTDVNTGEVKTVEETNMVTNAVNYILGVTIQDTPLTENNIGVT